MSRDRYHVIFMGYFALVAFYVFSIFKEGTDVYPTSFWPFVFLVVIFIGPNLLFLYDQVLKLGEEVESLKEQLGSKASDGSES